MLVIRQEAVVLDRSSQVNAPVENNAPFRLHTVVNKMTS